jgi:sulfur-carrier protein
MTLQLRFHATLRPIVGGRLVEVPFNAGTSVRQVLDGIMARHPALRPQLFDADGKLFRHVHVFVNGRDTHFLPDELDTVLRADDSLDVFPPVAGG